MKMSFFPGFIAIAIACGGFSLAQGQTGPSCFVNGTNATPVAPYTSWETAATNIQSGLDVAQNGATILVAPGVYRGWGNRDIDFKGRAITLKAAGGPAVTTIDCEGIPAEPHRGFYFHSGEGRSSKFVGFTIRHGYGPAAALTVSGSGSWSAGGAIYCAHGASPTIEGNVIEDNSAQYGGGIMVWNGSQPPVWQEIPHFESTNRVTLPMLAPNAFFRR
jgi:hypothetical protein